MKFAILIFSVLSISACASLRPPDYQAAGANGMHRTGYVEQRAAPGVWRVTYIDTDSGRAYRGFLHRAAELAQGNGAKFFSIDNGQTGKDRDKFNHADLSLPQFEGTVRLQKEKTGDSFEAAEILTQYQAAK